MSFPVLPFPLVHFLAAISSERLGLDNGARNITIVATHDRSARSRRMEIREDAHWQEIVTTSLAMVAEDDTDTVSIIYPSSDNSPSDMGVLMEGGKEPMVFTWTYGPAFQMTLVDGGEARDMVLNGAGVQETQAILNRLAGSAKSPEKPKALEPNPKLAVAFKELLTVPGNVEILSPKGDKIN